ncbi:MAG TPA: di-heme oxidoredictase family protein [Povalibacter sp.]|nr:di-heme oxidoredictase family protein [Povalibacter sp.]
MVQDDMRAPRPWRSLTQAEQARFDLGLAVFNTEWSAATGASTGRTDGLGPLFNVQSCDACHNSRRRGRGPRGDGEAPLDLVIQLGRLSADGQVERGIPEYGHVLNTNAVSGFVPEAVVSIRYDTQVHTYPDGSTASLRVPSYSISRLSGAPLSEDVLIMPRMPPSVQGVGLLERVSDSELQRLASSGRSRDVSGRVSWSSDSTPASIGRFGWQATEHSVASQTASAFAREMGLSTQLIGTHADCGVADAACRNAPNGGSPEVEANLFDALITFQELHAVPVSSALDRGSKESKLFENIGCAECHRSALPVHVDGGVATIHPYTDLLLHDLGPGLADRELAGKAAPGEWRTAPLWGLAAAAASGQPLRLLHDGRARSVEEAILWHDGEALRARQRFENLSVAQRSALANWVERL